MPVLQTATAACCCCCCCSYLGRTRGEANERHTAIAILLHLKALAGRAALQHADGTAGCRHASRLVPTRQLHACTAAGTTSRQKHGKRQLAG